MSQQRTHTQTFTQGINQRIPPERTNGLIKTQNARLSSLGETAQISRIKGCEIITNDVIDAQLLDTIVFGAYNISLFKNTNQYYIQLRNNSSMQLEGINNYQPITSDTEDYPTLVVNNNTIFITQLGKMINYINGKFYLNDLRPKIPIVSNKLLFKNTADERVDYGDNVVKRISMPSQEVISGAGLDQTIRLFYNDPNRAAGLDVSGVPSSLDRIFNISCFNGLTVEDPMSPGTYSSNVIIESFYNTSNVSGNDSLTLNFRAPFYETNYRYRITCHPRNFPDLTSSTGGAVFALLSPTIDSIVVTERQESNNLEYWFSIQVQGKQFFGNQVQIINTFNYGLSQTYTKSSTIDSVERIYKVRPGTDPYTLGKSFMWTDVGSVIRPATVDEVTTLTVDVNTPGSNDPRTTASRSIQMTIPAWDSGGNLEEFIPNPGGLL